MSRSGTSAAVPAAVVPMAVVAATGRAASTVVTSKRATMAVGATGGSHQRGTSRGATMAGAMATNAGAVAAWRARRGVMTVAAVATIRAAMVGAIRWAAGGSRVATVVVRAAMAATLGMTVMVGGSRAATVVATIGPPSLPMASHRGSPALPVSGMWHQRAVATTPTRTMTVAGAGRGPACAPA